MPRTCISTWHAPCLELILALDPHLPVMFPLFRKLGTARDSKGECQKSIGKDFWKAQTHHPFIPSAYHFIIHINSYPILIILQFRTLSLSASSWIGFGSSCSSKSAGSSMMSSGLGITAITTPEQCRLATASQLGIPAPAASMAWCHGVEGHFPEKR